MKVVHKFYLKEVTTLNLPEGVKILKVGGQGGEVAIWCELDPSEINRKNIEFRVFGTGWDIPDVPPLEYIDTAFLSNGLVFHVYRLV